MNDNNLKYAQKREKSYILKGKIRRWKDIDWRKAEEYVNRLQIRIVKAKLANKNNLVKRLQYMLVHSFYAKVIAIRKVTSNRGKRTAGVDGKIWITEADENSYGFRINRNCHDAMQKIFTVLARKNSAEWILEGDIKGCFDNISHKWILENIPMDKKILNKFIKAGYVYKKKVFPTNKGAIQGGAISPTLANMTFCKIYHISKE